MRKRSPFPGMDPWLEQFWGDVHAALATYARDQLNERLVPGLVARMQERVYIESPLLEGRQWSPDVHVFEKRRAPAQTAGRTGGVVAEPELLHVGAVEVRESYIEIRDARTAGKVVTVIEVVSKTNKNTKVGRRKYLQKQREVVNSETSLVELDLLRGGRGVTLASGELVPAAKRTAYHACVRRGAKPDILEYYALALRDTLPAISVPLRPTDSDVALDLQSLVDEAYLNGRYWEIDYDDPPKPKFNAEDAQWAAALIGAWRGEISGKQ